MLSEDFEKLAERLSSEADKSPLALTITLPTHRRSPDNAQDTVRVRNGARRAMSSLKNFSLDRSDSAKLQARLSELEREVDRQVGFRNTDLGLACYVTVDSTTVVSLGHTPPERVIMSDEFSLAAPLADLVSSEDVDVLVLTTGGGSTDGARMYRMVRGELLESGAAGFPLSWDIRDRDRSYTSTVESDKRDALVENFLRQVNANLLSAGSSDASRPYVVVGIRRLRDHWRKVAPASIAGSVVAEVDGNFDRVSLASLAAAVSSALERSARDRVLAAVGRMSALEQGRVATVSDDVYRLAEQGRVKTLLVEEGAIDEVRVDGVVLADRVAVAIRRAYDSGASVVVVPEDMLAVSSFAEGGRIAAEIRW